MFRAFSDYCLSRVFRLEVLLWNFIQSWERISIHSAPSCFKSFVTDDVMAFSVYEIIRFRTLYKLLITRSKLYSINPHIVAKVRWMSAIHTYILRNTRLCKRCPMEARLTIRMFLVHYSWILQIFYSRSV